MEEALRIQSELQKQNTDCVYFLASPLTCKKGLNCEYRHNEMARFNTTDCWYWLAGNCFNPNCSFRHPPLESQVDPPSKSAQLAYECSVPTNKTDVLCYFYYNGFCNKGDKCYFLHDYDSSGSNEKSSKPANAIIHEASLDNKASIKNDSNNPPETTVPMKKADMIIQSEENENLQLSAPKVVQQVSAPECNIISMISPESLLPAKNFARRKFYRVGDLTEPDEPRDSSPGSDILVNEKLENVNYHDAEFRYESPIYDSCDSSDNELIYEVKEIPDDSRERMVDCFLPYKRKHSMTERANDQEGVDLRYHLKNHRIIDDHHHPIGRLSRSHLIGQRQKSSRISRGPCRGFGSDMRKSYVNISNRDRGVWLENTLSNKSRQQHYKGKRFSKEKFLPSEFLKRKPYFGQKWRKTEASPKFTGPKTLAQIKEDKKKAKENHNSFPKTTSTDFQGPRPLSEILKEKKKLFSAANENRDSC